MSFVLASQSPSRLALLKQIGYVPGHVAPQDVDESEFPKELPKDYLWRVTRMKVDSALKAFPDSIILGADTIVVTGRRIFQRPQTKEEASKMLTHFSGRRVKVVSSVCVARGETVKQKTIATVIQIKRFSKLELDCYLQLKDWSHFSGGLAIDEIGGAFIKAINGSHSNVMGLPLYETKNLLESFGVYPDWMKKENS